MSVAAVPKTNNLSTQPSHNFKNYVGEKLLHAALGCHYLGFTIKVLAAPILIPTGSVFSLFFRKATRKYAIIKLDIREKQKRLKQLDVKSTSVKNRLKKSIMKNQAKRIFLFAPAFLGYIGECLSLKSYKGMKPKADFAFILLHLSTDGLESHLSTFQIRKSIAINLILGNFLSLSGIELMSDRVERVENAMKYIANLD